jgi:hypothetical protein
MNEVIRTATTIVSSEVVLISFCILFGGGVPGLAIGQMLPKDHLGEETLAAVHPVGTSARFPNQQRQDQVRSG